MSKRNGAPREKTAERNATADAIERRVVAYAEQLGWLVGTVQAKAEGWLDRDTLTKQISSIRDGAADLLERIAADDGGEAAEPSAAPRRGMNKGRSGGVVDAPGKKHRRPMPQDPKANAADRKRAKAGSRSRSVKSLRGRGQR